VFSKRKKCVGDINYLNANRHSFLILFVFDKILLASRNTHDHINRAVKEKIIHNLQSHIDERKVRE